MPSSRRRRNYAARAAGSRPPNRSRHPFPRPPPGYQPAPARAPPAALCRPSTLHPCCPPGQSGKSRRPGPRAGQPTPALGSALPVAAPGPRAGGKPRR